MKKKMILSLWMMCISSLAFSQTGFFQTLDTHGAETKFIEFYSISKSTKTEGTYTIAGPRYTFSPSREKLDNGINIGNTFTTDESQNIKSWYKTDMVHRKDSLIGYPNTYMIYDKSEKKGQVIIDDFIFILEGVDPSNMTYTGIDVLMVNTQYGKDEETETEIAKEEEAQAESKKSKIKGKLGALKDKAVSNVAGGQLGLMIKIQKLNLDEVISTYLAGMRAKDEAYTRTSSEEQEWQTILKARDDYRRGVKKARDDYWSSDAGRATHANYGKKSPGSCRYTVKNASFTSIYYLTSKGSELTLSAGQSTTFSCSETIYRSVNGNKGSLIAGGNSSFEGRTIVLE